MHIYMHISYHKYVNKCTAGFQMLTWAGNLQIQMCIHICVDVYRQLLDLTFSDNLHIGQFMQMYIYMYICVCVCVCAYMYIYTHVYIYT